jgi:hypothetical protein
MTPRPATRNNFLMPLLATAGSDLFATTSFSESLSFHENSGRRSLAAPARILQSRESATSGDSAQVRIADQITV